MNTYPQCLRYWTLSIPWTAYNSTDWHPTERTGPFSVLTRGVFDTPELAVSWALLHGVGNATPTRMVLTNGK